MNSKEFEMAMLMLGLHKTRDIRGTNFQCKAYDFKADSIHDQYVLIVCVLPKPGEEMVFVGVHEYTGPDMYSEALRAIRRRIKNDNR